MHIAPLRERAEDIAELLQYGIAKFNRRFWRCVTGLSAGAMDCFHHYKRPGNVRELIHLPEATYINPAGEETAYSDLSLRFREQAARYHESPESDGG